MFIEYKKISPNKKAHVKEKFAGSKNKRPMKRAFFNYLYRHGFLEKIKDRVDIQKMMATLETPEGFSIHHIRPIGGSGYHDLKNLCLIEHELHTFLHKFCYDPVKDKLKVGQIRSIEIPDLEPVALFDEHLPFVWGVIKNLVENPQYRRENYYKINKHQLAQEVNTLLATAKGSKEYE